MENLPYFDIVEPLALFWSLLLEKRFYLKNKTISDTDFSFQFTVYVCKLVWDSKSILQICIVCTMKNRTIWQMFLNVQHKQGKNIYLDCLNKRKLYILESLGFDRKFDYWFLKKVPKKECKIESCFSTYIFPQRNSQAHLKMKNLSHCWSSPRGCRNRNARTFHQFKLSIWQQDSFN